MRAPVRLLTVSLAAVAFLAACGDDPASEPPHGASSSGTGATGGEGGGGGGTGGSAPISHGACDGLAPGPTGADSVAVGLSRAHASFRFFGAHGATNDVDQALVTALQGGLASEEAVLQAYVATLGSGCALEASEAASPGAAKVELQGDVAWVRFGSGAIAIPEGATSIIVDMRGAAEGPELDGFLDAVGSAVLDVAPPSLEAKLRRHTGMRDEAYAPLFLGTENVYDDDMVTVDLLPLAATASTTLAIGVVAGERIAPSAARFALTLRAAGRAALLGHDVQTWVAESVWAPVVGFGFAHRVATLLGGGAPLPDVVAADVAGDDDAALAQGFKALSGLAPIGGAATRPELDEIPNTSDLPEANFDRATRTAALIVAHGAMKNFFAYWSVVDDESDTRLDGALALADEDPDEVASGRRELGFLAHALHDSHGFVFRTTGSSQPRIPAVLDESDTAEPVVRVSLLPAFAPGDTVVAIDDVPAADVMAERAEFVASSDSSAFRNAATTLLELPAAATFTLRDAEGTLRDELVDPGALPSGYPAYPGRGAGTLADLGHPELHYVNLDGAALTSAELPAAIAGVDASQGVVFDMRGYPSPPAWTLLQHVLPRGAPGVPMREMLVTALGIEWEDTPQPFAAAANAFEGPIAMIVGAHTQSQAEHLTLALQSASRVHVVGQPSAGANGNITGVLVPGAFGLTFTGLEVRQPDLSVFHGVGVKVDDAVAVKPSDLAAGLDPELERAITWLLSQ